MEELRKTLSLVSDTLASMSPIDFQSNLDNPGINEVTIKALIMGLASPEWREMTQSEVQTTKYVSEGGRTSYRYADLVHSDVDGTEILVIELKYVKPDLVDGCAPTSDSPPSYVPESPYRPPLRAARIASRFISVMKRHGDVNFDENTGYTIYFSRRNRLKEEGDSPPKSKKTNVGVLVHKEARKQLDIWVKHVPELEGKNVKKVAVVFSGPKYLVEEFE